MTAKVLIDACVLFPTVAREVLLAVAKEGLFKPCWSPRILEEWARAARKIGPTGEVQARAEIALMTAAWPGCSFDPKDGDLGRLWLPDPNDIHVLAAAIAASADLLLTWNHRDFPRRTLQEEGLDRADPDGFLMELWMAAPAPVEAAVGRVHSTAVQMAGSPKELRPLLKKARLPRLARALGSQQQV